MRRCRLVRVQRAGSVATLKNEWLTDEAEVTQNIHEAATFAGPLTAVLFSIEHRPDPYNWAFEAIDE
jgi:hypothetical protein